MEEQARRGELAALSDEFGIQIDDVARIESRKAPIYHIFVEGKDAPAVLSDFALQGTWRREISLTAEKLPKAMADHRSPLASDQWDDYANRLMAVARHVRNAQEAHKPRDTIRKEDIWRFRKNLGKTQAEFAEMVECSADAVAKWEGGYRSPTGARLKRLRDLMSGKLGDPRNIEG